MKTKQNNWTQTDGCREQATAVIRREGSPLDSENAELLKQVDREFGRLRSQVIEPAQGKLRYDYLVPGGIYKQCWDWDGFFTGLALADLSVDDARYLKWWALNFVEQSDPDGYVSGCLTPGGGGN